MPLRAIQIGFFGNFQCRLATDPDAPDASPADPRAGNGWTFTFGEVAFDRRIRFDQPVSLRDGLMDGWRSVRVNHVRGDRGGGMAAVPTDPAMGALVRLGETAYFDQAAGGGAFTQDAVMNINLRFGEGPAILLSASPVSTPNIVVSSDQNRQDEYMRVKPSRAVSHAGRRAEIASRLPWYSAVFGFMGTIDQVAMNQPSISRLGGVLQEAASGPRGAWQLHLDFYRFDADTLVGTANGWLDGVFPAAGPT
ncbi:MAG: hypothetical protein SFV51_04535 [Bryobacteraceae bacterium]|nr:hypothetical protein [Bryobacteraceae bacterium]